MTDATAQPLPAPPTPPVAETVFITSEPLDLLPAGIFRDLSKTSVVALGLNGGQGEGVLPARWLMVEPGDLAQADDLREQFFGFLDEWPHRAGQRGRSFNDRFTVGDRYSIWWTTVAADRQATRGIVKYFRYAAVVDRMIARWDPKTILLFTRDPLLSRLVRSRAEHAGVAVRPLQGCADPVDRTVGVSARWLVRGLWHAVASPLQRLAFAARYRWALRGAELFQRSTRPTVVFASTWPRHMALRAGQFSQVYWGELSKALEALEPSVAQAYLPRKLEEIVDAETSVTGLDAIRSVNAPLLIWERYFPAKGLLSRIGRQFSLLWRFYVLARRPEFRESFRFAGTNLAPVLLPELRDGIGRAIDWSFKSAQVEAALRAAGSVKGNVKAVVVSEEMYRPAMPTLAAARALGIPTIGVQHGTIMPTHFMYALPRGHVEYAPVPDYFGAYGEYAKEVLSVHGAYPADRVWITGAARLDPLINRLPDQSTARATLGLPPDARIVVLATQTFPWFVSALRAVLECMREHPEALLCVKKNPSVHAMSLAQIEDMAAELGVRNIRGFDAHTELLLAACSVWISASSTTLLEATLIGRPTICLNFSGQPDRYPYVEEGVSLSARGVGELKASLAGVLGEPGARACEDRRRAFLTRHVGPTTEGRGAVTLAQRVADLVAG
jgi:surface carbohydrate biosynthesis protein (TIGR04326 family)